jgi:hypothetical protein
LGNPTKGKFPLTKGGLSKSESGNVVRFRYTRMRFARSVIPREEKYLATSGAELNEAIRRFISYHPGPRINGPQKRFVWVVQENLSRLSPEEKDFSKTMLSLVANVQHREGVNHVLRDFRVLVVTQRKDGHDIPLLTFHTGSSFYGRMMYLYVCWKHQRTLLHKELKNRLKAYPCDDIQAENIQDAKSPRDFIARLKYRLLHDYSYFNFSGVQQDLMKLTHSKNKNRRCKQNVYAERSYTKRQLNQIAAKKRAKRAKAAEHAFHQQNQSKELVDVHAIEAAALAHKKEVIAERHERESEKKIHKGWVVRETKRRLKEKEEKQRQMNTQPKKSQIRSSHGSITEKDDVDVPENQHNCRGPPSIDSIEIDDVRPSSVDLGFEMQGTQIEGLRNVDKTGTMTQTEHESSGLIDPVGEPQDMLLLLRDEKGKRTVLSRDEYDECYSLGKYYLARHLRHETEKDIYDDFHVFGEVFTSASRTYLGNQSTILGFILRFLCWFLPDTCSCLLLWFVFLNTTIIVRVVHFHTPQIYYRKLRDGDDVRNACDMGVKCVAHSGMKKVTEHVLRGDGSLLIRYVLNLYRRRNTHLIQLFENRFLELGHISIERFKASIPMLPPSDESELHDKSNHMYLSYMAERRFNEPNVAFPENEGTVQRLSLFYLSCVLSNVDRTMKQQGSPNAHRAWWFF